MKLKNIKQNILTRNNHSQAISMNYNLLRYLLGTFSLK